MRLAADCSWAKTARTSAVRDLPTTHLTRFSSLDRTRMAAPTITAGRTGTVSCQRTKPCLIRLAGRAMISASLIRPIHRACARRLSLARILSEDAPIGNVLAFPPQQITAPLAIEAADSSFTGIDFVPDFFARGPVQRGAALYSLEGDFGFSRANGTPEAGHEIKLVNFSREEEPLALKIMRFAHNNTFEQAFVSGARGFNRPTNVKFGPDGCAWVVDYGAVRDFGQSDPDSKFIVPGDGPLVQIPQTGVIWRICPQ